MAEQSKPSVNASDDQQSRKLKKLSVNASYDEEKEGEEKTRSDWIIKIDDIVKQKKSYPSGRSWSIHKLTPSMWKVQKSAFAPKIISIGPIHRERDTMLEHKTRYLLRLLGCKLKGNNGTEGHEENVAVVRMDALVEAMQKLEKKARQCYSETFDDIDSKDFVDMMIVDGCFVIELLRLYQKPKNNRDDDPIFTTRWMIPTLRRDLIMLENQLPFFVLEELFGLIEDKKPEESSPMLQELALRFFSEKLPTATSITSKVHSPVEYKHLLHLFRFNFIATINSSSSQATLPNHCASELKDVGIAFETRSGHELIDIDFQGGILRMPQLTISDDTVPVFLNFLAYEQSDEKANSYFTNYFAFVDSLINEPKDVEILRNCGIIKNELGSDTNVADLIIKLRREIVFDGERCHLSDPMNNMKTYWRDRHKYPFLVWCRRMWKKSDPWIVLSVLAAILLLLLTGALTYYTICTYYNPTDGIGLRVSSS